MDFPTDKLLEEVLRYRAVHDIKVTISSSGKYAMIIGGSTFLGGIIGGPPGLAVGGVLSSIISAALASNEFESVPHIVLYKTTPAQREKLALLIVKFLNLRHIWTFKDFLHFNTEELALGIIPIIKKFLTNDMHYSIVN